METDSQIPLSADSPPPLPMQPDRKSVFVRQLLAILLSLFLGLFLMDAFVSLLDGSLILFFGVYSLSIFQGVVCFFALLSAFVIYCLMGLFPMIPKRLFLPVTLFNPVAVLVAILFSIYFFNHLKVVAWIISLFQVAFGLGILFRIQGGFKVRWPLVPVERLKDRCFSWRNLSVFALVNVFVLLPALVVYLAVCAALAVGHFSDGFLALRPGGLTVQVRKYVRDDGKTIQLYPMAHIADATFYQKLAESFPTNSMILMEGVSDDSNLLTNKISYKRAAKSLGLAEQQKEFKPTGEIVRADIDVEEFAASTIDLINLVMLFHTKGVNDDTMAAMTHYTPPPHFEKQLFDDLLRKRNRHLLEEIHSHLSETDNIIVPWGAAHIPEIAKEIQKSGFRLDETQEYVAIKFRSSGSKSKTAGKETDEGTAK